MKIIIILLLSIKLAYLLDLNVTNYHFNKRLISNGQKYDAEKYPCKVTPSLLTYCTNATGYQYNNTYAGSFLKQKYVLTFSLAPRWLNKNNIKVRILNTYAVLPL